MNNESLSERTCPNCGGTIIENQESMMLECDSCGTVFGAIQKEKGYIDVQYNYLGEVSSIKVNSQNAMDTVNKIISESDERHEQNRIEARKKEKAEKRTTGIVLLILGIILLLCIMVGGYFASRGISHGIDYINSIHQNEVRMPCSSKDFKGDDYEDVVQALEIAGFTNIHPLPLEDLVTGFIHSDGEVDEILINGDNSTFEAGSYYSVDSYIVIKYHSFKNKKDKDKEEKTETADTTAEPESEATSN